MMRYHIWPSKELTDRCMWAVIGNRLNGANGTNELIHKILVDALDHLSIPSHIDGGRTGVGPYIHTYIVEMSEPHAVLFKLGYSDDYTIKLLEPS